MKKTLVFALAAVLVLGCAAAFAEYVPSANLDGCTLTMLDEMNLFTMYRNGEGLYTVVDAQGNPVNDQKYLSAWGRDPFILVQTSEEINSRGLIDAQGAEVVPARYGDIEVLSDRWAVGVTKNENKENTGYDVYYRGVLAGHLGPKDYKYALPYGDFLQVRDHEDVYHHYDKAMTESGSNEIGEYSYDSWNKVYYHTGTNQPAFTPECTLTPDQVKVCYQEVYGKGVTDLQGNVAFPLDGRTVYLTENSVFRFSADSGYGLIDAQGGVVLPAEYAGVSYEFARTLPYGYVMVKDANGLGGYVSLSGEDTSATFRYPADELSEYGLFLRWRDGENRYHVISAVAGELETVFDEVDFNYSSANTVFVGKTADGTVAVYGLNGEVVLTDPSWHETWHVDVSRDGTLILGQTNYSTYTIYTLGETGAAEPVKEPAEPEELIASEGTRTIVGQISDSAAGEPVGNARVSVYDEGREVARTRTDDAGHYTIGGLAEKDYTVVATAEDRVAFSGSVSVQDTDITYVETYPMVTGTGEETGTASGHVLSALTGQGVGGVALTVRAGWNTQDGETLAAAATDGEGAYSFDLPVGNYTVAASLSGYTDLTFNIVVQADRNTGSQNGTISPILGDGEYRVVLTWGDNPADLDSHLVGSKDSGEQFHVFWYQKAANENSASICTLDVDDRDGRGPETITLHTTNSAPYYYFVHHYDGEGAIGSTSAARVELYSSSALLAVYNAPTNQGDGKYWNVFALVDGQFIVRNTVTDDADLGYAHP